MRREATPLKQGDSSSGGDESSRYSSEQVSLRWCGRSLGSRSSRSNRSRGSSHSGSSTRSRRWPFSSKQPDPPSIFEAIKKYDWDYVRKLLAKEQDKVEAGTNAELCRKIDDSTGISVLGLVFGFHAPLDIIQTVLTLAPEVSLKEDQFGAIPLHIACLNGSPVQAIKALLDHDDKLTAVCVDEDLRAPLHHAVEFACRPHCDHDPEQKNTTQPQHADENAGMDVVRILCEACPEMVTFSDRNGDTPIDIAQIVKLEARKEEDEEYQRADRVYTLLKDVSISVYRKQKSEFEALGHCKKYLGPTPTTEYPKKIEGDFTLSTASMTITTGNDTEHLNEDVSSLSNC